jgi:hypothetical protein
LIRRSGRVRAELHLGRDATIALALRVGVDERECDVVSPGVDARPIPVVAEVSAEAWKRTRDQQGH